MNIFWRRCWRTRTGRETLIEASASLRLQIGHREGDRAVDPHLWLDPNNVIVYVENIRDGLTQFRSGRGRDL